MIACVNLPALPLQLLLLEHPDWAAYPMAVVDRDAPTGKVLWVNQRAWRERIRPGMRYAAALSLSGELRAAPVEPSRVEQAVDAVTLLLQDFSPAVEAAREYEGVFWLSAAGLGRLYAGVEPWADAVEKSLRDAGYHATLVVGFERFGTLVLALARHRGRVLESLAQERRVMGQVPLERLKLEPRFLAAMHKLGVRTLGQFLRLPRAQISKRFGGAADRLYAQARSDAEVPVQARQVAEELVEAIDFERPERNTERLLFCIKSKLPALVGALLARGEALLELRLILTLERGAGEKQECVLRERVRPANPTLDEALILDLVRLRLSALVLPMGAVRLEALAVPFRAHQRQATLIETNPKRDLEAGSRALARLRAELGDSEVGVLLHGDGHLPEAQMVWQPITRLKRAAPQRRMVRPMVRRIELTPPVLPPRARYEPDGWLVRGPEDGPVVRSTGPHIVSGGWWATEIHREYHYLETAKGMLLWVFYDRRRRRWYLQGRVE